VNPPQPTLGYVLSSAAISMRARPEGLLASGGAIWACALAFYSAADALVGFFHSKEALVRLNE
jgi:ABC-type dipeptide/oligopeptide/nickel transport system permease subunit